MPLNIAIQMDPIESIRYHTDTSFILGVSAQERGHTLYYYQPRDAFLKNGTLYAHLTELTLRREENNYFTKGKTELRPLGEMDVILIRQDPPFDMNYLTYTYWLENLKKTKVINPPQEIRNCPEKLFVTEFTDFTPPTLISANPAHILEFYAQEKDIILKPLYSYGGNDVFHAEASSDNVDGMISALLRLHPAPLVAQKFLPNIRTTGDIRVILIDGEIGGALRRIPADHSVRSNLIAGGRAEKAELNTKEKTICEAVGAKLREKNILLAGIDLIDGHLTEINITSPTGIQVINRLENKKLEEMFWNKVER